MTLSRDLFRGERRLLTAPFPDHLAEFADIAVSIHIRGKHRFLVIDFSYSGKYPLRFGRDIGVICCYAVFRPIRCADKGITRFADAKRITVHGVINR